MNTNAEFIERFIEVCGTTQPAQVQRLLNISYQSAKNYLQGRVPSPDILVTISERTSYSIDWLLTGRGKKFVEGHSALDTLVLTRQFETIVRKICVEVIGEVMGENTNSQPRTVKLHSGELMSEKVLEKVNTLTDKEA